MARLPSVDQLERPALRGNANVVPISSGFSGQVLSGTGQAVTRVAQEFEVAQDHVDTLIAEDRYNKLRQQQMELTMGKEGFVNVKSGDVFGIVPKYNARFQDAVGATEQGLSESQRQKFHQRAAASALQFQSDLMRHVTQESDVYASEVFRSTIDTESDAAVANWATPHNAASSILRIQSAIDREGQRTGWPQKQIEETKRAAESKIHRDIIDMMTTNEQERSAEGYYDAVKGKLTAGDQVAVQAVLQRARRQIEDDTWETVGQGIQKGETEVFKDPAQFDATYNAGKTIIDNLPDVREKNRVKWRAHLFERLATAKVLSLGQDDPDGTVAQLRGIKPEPYGYEAPSGPAADFTGKPSAPARGVRNNNPGNLQKTSTPWQGEVPGEDPRFSSFETPEAGIAATAKQLVLYQEKHGINTVQGVVEKWAPATDKNDVPAYVAAVSKSMGVKPDQELDLHDAATLKGLTSAIIAHENGRNPYGADRIQTGVDVALGKRELPRNADASGTPPVGVESDHPKIGDPFYDTLPLDLRMKLLREVTTMANQGNARAKHALQSKIQDFTAMAHSGVEIPLSSIPTEHELIRAFGQDDGPRMYKEVQESLQLNGDIREVRGMSYQEQDQRLAQRVSVPGEGFAASEHRQDSLVRAINYVRKQQKDDPGAWTVSSVPAVRSAWQKAQDTMQTNDPVAVKHAFEDYASATIAEQQRIGMDVKILPGDVADKIVSQFYRQQQGGQNAAQLIQGLSQQWGKYWPEVYSQLQKEIPGSARSIAAGMPDTAAARLAGLADVKKEELLVGLPPGTDKDINDQLTKLFAQAHDSLLATNTRDGQDEFASTYKNAEKLGLSYVGDGKGTKEAAQQAYDDTFGHRYEFVKSGSTYFRAPKSGPYPVADVTAGANAIKADVGAFDLAVPKSLAGLKPEDARKAWVDVLKDGSYWVNAETVLGPGESGLVLMTPRGGAVLDSKGVPIFRSWEQLAKQPVKTLPGSNLPVRYDYAGQAITTPTQAVAPYGKREDGTPKGEGFFGLLPRKDKPNMVSSELSIGVEWDGKEHLIPSMVPTLDRRELDYLLNGGSPVDHNNPIANSIMRKATAYAQERIRQGKSAFAGPGEKFDLPPEEPVSHADQVPEEPPVAEMPDLPVKPRTTVNERQPKPITQKYTREYTPDGEPVKDTFPPGEHPKFKPPNADKLEKDLRGIWARENLAGKLMREADDQGDRVSRDRRMGIVNKLFDQRQAILRQLRKVDPKRAEKLRQELYQQ